MDKQKEKKNLIRKIEELEEQIRKLSSDKEISRNESIYKDILEHSTNAFYSHTPDHKITYFSKQASHILGYTPEEMMIKWIELATDNPINKEGLRLTNLAIETGIEQAPYELELMHKSGKKIYVEVHEAPVVENGKTTAIVGALTDITNQKVAGIGLEESERKYTTLFEQAADGILVGIKGGEIVDANQSILALTGYGKKELIGKNIGFLFEKEELNEKPLRYDLIKKGDTVIRERNIIGKAGRVIPVEMNTKILKDGRMQALFRDLTRRKDAENQLKESRDLLQKAEIIAGLGSYYYDVKMDSWTSSEVLNEIYGIDKDFQKNFENWLNIIHPEFKQEMLNYFTINILKNQEPFDKEYKIKRISDGKELWVHGFGEIELNELNQAVSIFGTIQNITIRKEAEIALRESEEKYRNIFLNSPLGVVHYNHKGVITDCNEHFVNIIGSSKDKLVGLDMIKGLRNKKLIKAIKESIKYGESIYEDWYNSVTAEKTTYVRILLKSIKDKDNRIISGIGLVEDITERKNAEEELKQRTLFLNSIIEGSAISMWISDDKGTAIRTNQACLDFFGATEEEIIGKYNLFSDSVLQKNSLIPEIKNVFEKGEVANIIVDYNFGEVENVDVKNATHKIVNSIFTPVMDSKGKVTNVVVQAIDLTEIKEAEKALKESEEKHRLLYENANDAIFLMDKEIFIDCNRKTMEMFKCTREQIVGALPYEFSPTYQPDGRLSEEKAKEKIKEALKGKPRVFDWIHKRFDGTEFFAEVSLNAFELNSKTVIQAIVRDVSERKELEQKIFSAVSEAEEKERQRIASDIHDELGPVLSSMKMYIESLNDSDDTKKQNYLKGQLKSLIKESINNVREVSNALNPYLLSKHGLKSAVRSFLDNSSKLIEIKLETNLDIERFPISTEIVYYRIIKELFNNTIKHAKAKEVFISLNYINKELILVYTDDGIGIKKNELSLIEKKGRGLLNIINRVKSIKGNFKFKTDGQKGFEFQLIKKTEEQKI